MDRARTLAEHNAKVHRQRGIGVWRELFLEFIRRLAPSSVLELGSGDPAFLAALPPGTRRLALDGNRALVPSYEAAGIDFAAFDFDLEGPPVTATGFEVAVCSDVFEHLIDPLRSLRFLEGALRPEGVLLSHVPNEYRFKKTVKIMLGRRTATYHHSSEEWDDPHIRRFTDRGYRKFLSQVFRYSLKLTDLRYRGLAVAAKRLGFTLPFCFERGPTYASTSDPETHRRLMAVKEAMRRDGPRRRRPV